LLEQVGIHANSSRSWAYPHQLSVRANVARVMIATALGQRARNADADDHSADDHSGANSLICWQTRKRDLDMSSVHHP
jgi:ABC-type antimicrobial peptide transport system ATPase subunit